MCAYIFLLQVCSSPSEYHCNCNYPSLVALSQTAADFFLSIKTWSVLIVCPSFQEVSQCVHSFHGYFPWKWFLGLNLKAPSFWHFSSELTILSFMVYNYFRPRMQLSWDLLTSFLNLSLLEVSPKRLHLPCSKSEKSAIFSFFSLWRRQSNGLKDDYTLGLGR